MQLQALDDGPASLLLLAPYASLAGWFPLFPPSGQQSGKGRSPLLVFITQCLEGVPRRIRRQGGRLAHAGMDGLKHTPAGQGKLGQGPLLRIGKGQHLPDFGQGSLHRLHRLVHGGTDSFGKGLHYLGSGLLEQVHSPVHYTADLCHPLAPQLLDAVQLSSRQGI